MVSAVILGVVAVVAVAVGVVVVVLLWVFLLLEDCWTLCGVC